MRGNHVNAGATGRVVVQLERQSHVVFSNSHNFAKQEAMNKVFM